MTEKDKTAKAKSSKEAALIAARAIDEKRGTDIVIQDVSALLDITDYFVIATAANKRRADAIAEEVEDCLREQAGIKPDSREGTDDAKWILLDYGNIVVHIFQAPEREFYQLETLWKTAPTLDVAAAGIKDPIYTERIAALLESNKSKLEADNADEHPADVAAGNNGEHPADSAQENVEDAAEAAEQANAAKAAAEKGE